MDAEELLEKYAAGNRKFHNANLQGIDLKGVDLSEIDLYRASLNGADLSEARLIKASLWETSLSRASLISTNLVGIKGGSINLSWADLSDGDLSYANLTNANLTGADLTGANLTGANIYGANLKNADLTGAIMPNGQVYKPIASQVEVGKQEASLEKVISMTREVINTDKAPAPVGPYNQAIAASGKLLFVAGQIPIDPRLGDVVYTDDVVKQTEQVLANLQAILEAGGATFADVVKTTVFLADLKDFAAVNAVYAKYFPETTAPARACVQVSRLPKDVLVEIDAIAVIGNS